MSASENPSIEEMESEGGLNNMRRLALAIALRRIEGLRLYEPLPGEQTRFHKSMALERVVRGGNRSGKTLACAREVAMIVTGQDTSGRLPKENGICYCVGFDGKHIADPMWKKLSRAGAFKIIRDIHGGHWRAYRPWLPEDLARKDEAKPAPPLIAPRMIKSIAWETKKLNQPSMVLLHSGWQIHFYSGNAKPPQGSQAHLAWFDEELADGEWYPEIAARLFDFRGYFLWSATPQAGTDRLYQLHERAEHQEEHDTQPRTVEEFVLHIDDNMHFTKEHKEELLDKFTEDDRDVRTSGDFSRINRVYPEYVSKYHEIAFRLMPPDWTRYAVIDPGRQVCAVLFAAVPPPGNPDSQHIFLYDEIYIRNCDAIQFGQAMQRKCMGQTFYQFLIDPHEAPKHDTGGGRTVEEQYREQLMLHGVRCQTTGFGFTLGDMQVEAGIEAVRPLLRRIGLQEPMTAKGVFDPQAKLYNRYSPLRVIGEKMPNFIWEIKRYRYKRTKGIVQNAPEQKHNHLMDCLRYLAQARPVWVPPTRRGFPVSPAFAAFQKFTFGRGNQQEGILLGPGPMHPK